MIDGARCDDVDGKLVHISLTAMPEGPERAALLAIPTGLTVKRQDVTGSAQLQTFLANYPPQPIAAHSVAKATAQRAP